MNIDDRGGLGQLALEPGAGTLWVTAQLGDLSRQRIGGLGERTGALIVQGGRATRQALAPRGELGGVQPVLTEQGAAARVATRVG